jgi:hypothetical protein
MMKLPLQPGNHATALPQRAKSDSVFFFVRAGLAPLAASGTICNSLAVSKNGQASKKKA